MTALRTYAAAAVAALAVVPAPAGAKACAGASRSGAWVSTPLPALTWVTTLRAVRSPSSPRADVLVVGHGAGVTNGLPRTIARTTDGGCTWTDTFSLDAYRTSDPLLADPENSVTSVAARADGTTVYAAVVWSLGSLTVPRPVSFVVSRDSGATWRTYSPPPASWAGEVPRCTTADLAPGTDDATAYLRCNDSSIGEIGTELAGVRCRTSYYVTRDYGATWTAIAPGNPPVGSTALASGCGAAGSAFVAPAPDPAHPRVVWDVLNNDSKTLTRSADDGRTHKPYAAVKKDGFAVWDLQVLSVRGRSVLGVWPFSGPGVFVTGPGRVEDQATIPLPVSQRGVEHARAVVPGTARVLCAYSDGEHRARVFGYDVLRRSWTELPAPAKNAWPDIAAMSMVASPRGTVWIASASVTYNLYRYAP